MNQLIRIALLSLITLVGCSVDKPGLGVKSGKLLPCPKTPNCVNSQAADDKHFITPIRYTGTQLEANDRLLQVLGREKQVKIVETQENYVRAEFRSALFRFVDDVEFYFPVIQAGEKVIHVRSASRIGYYDLGVNRKRIERIRNKF